jgi:hypothetical protein
MDTLPTYTAADTPATAWWIYALASGVAGRPRGSLMRREQVEARIAARRAAANTLAAAVHTRCERGVARLIRETTVI